MTEDPPTESEIIEQILAAARCETDFQFGPNLRLAINNAVQYPDLAGVRVQLANRLVDLDSAIGAGCLAVWLGASVENGAVPAQTLPGLLNALTKWIRVLNAIDSSTNENHSESHPQMLKGIDLICQGLVAHLARSSEHRESIGRSDEIIQKLEAAQLVSNGATWVLEALRKRSGTLIVLEIAHQNGVEVRYEHLSTCFHLFTMLQLLLTAEGKPFAQTIPAEPLPDQISHSIYPAEDSGRWHYGRGDTPTQDIAGTIWGEATPASIPIVEGRQVILLWPQILGGRHWNSGMFGPPLFAMPSKLEIISELSPENVQDWITRLNLPNPQRKSWWKFW